MWAWSVDAQSADAQSANSPAADWELCDQAILAAEIANGIPKDLLKAIARVESGRSEPVTGDVRPWPWTLNVKGAARYYDRKEDAQAAVERFRASNEPGIDVGCLQINLGYHGDAFASPAEALEPESNVRYGAGFLRALYASTGSWSDAVSRYHAGDQEGRETYQSRVMAHWRELGGHDIALTLPLATTVETQYVRARALATALQNAGLTVPAELLFLVMRGEVEENAALNESSTPNPEGIGDSNTRSGFDVRTAREKFHDPWAPPQEKDQDAGDQGRATSRSRDSLLSSTGLYGDSSTYSSTSRGKQLYQPSPRTHRKRSPRQ